MKTFEFDAAKWTAEMQNRDILESPEFRRSAEYRKERKSWVRSRLEKVKWLCRHFYGGLGGEASHSFHTVYGAREHFAPGMHREKEAEYKTQWFIDLASLTELRDPSDPDCAICKSPFVMPPVNAT